MVAMLMAILVLLAVLGLLVKLGIGLEKLIEARRNHVMIILAEDFQRVASLSFFMIKARK